MATVGSLPEDPTCTTRVVVVGGWLLAGEAVFANYSSLQGLSNYEIERKKNDEK